MKQNVFHNLLNSIQEFHSLVGIAFPMQAVKIGKEDHEVMSPAQDGSRIFISTKLFTECEKAALTVKAEFEKMDADVLTTHAQSCWTELADLLCRIKNAGRQGNISQINEAFVLLCLTSGLIQHFICSKVGIAVPQSQQFSKVEPLEKLLELCGRSDLKAHPVEKILDRVVEECRSSLRTN